MSEPKVHKRHPGDGRAMCGAGSSSRSKKIARLTSINAEVTCKTCRGWFPVGERALPKEVSRG
jgi:hypothetical protein